MQGYVLKPDQIVCTTDSADEKNFHRFLSDTTPSLGIFSNFEILTIFNDFQKSHFPFDSAGSNFNFKELNFLES